MGLLSLSLGGSGCYHITTHFHTIMKLGFAGMVVVEGSINLTYGTAAALNGPYVSEEHTICERCPAPDADAEAVPQLTPRRDSSRGGRALGEAVRLATANVS